MSQPDVVACARAFDAAIETAQQQGEEMMALMTRLFPICRSLTGAGIRETFDILGETLPLTRHGVPSGTQVYDWTVPKEWNIKDAYVKNSRGERIIDFQVSNLHLMSYSVPVRRTMTLAELKPHLHSLPHIPDAVPYLASYYRENWGFCLTHNQLESLTEDNYEVVIDSTLEPGSLDYCETRIGPATGPEVLISTYCCHPSLANNELSGPVLTAFLCDHLSRIEGLSFGYRVLFLPETIGSIAYLSKHGVEMVEQMRAGYVISCVGDDGPYTYMKSRRGDSAADIAAAHMLKYHVPAGIDVNIHDFAPDSGGDERQFNSPGFNLPVGSLLRSYPGEYREYHNSHDNLEYVSAKAMSDSLVAYLRIMQTHEMNRIFLNTNPYGEPQLGPRGLYPSVGVHPKFEDELRYLLYLLCYGDGEHDLMAIANKLDRPVWVFTEAIEKLMSAGLLKHAP